ncbi:ferrochelatase [Alphaproteobacteria bacterium]|nr:ferrochelatase [Alphaproteobacteria bacterium]MDC0453344.1 ferrochelatase [Alphaproteobacteria bacterium]
MKYFGEKNYEHGNKDKTGVLITNLGTPDAPNAKSLKIYLNQFLSDPRVIEIPKIIWQIILKLIILQIRPRKSAANYKKIWTDKGSPLLDISQRQLEGVKKIILEKYPNVEFALGMRYGNPSIEKALKDLQKKQVRRLLVLPLYPQYCAATTASTFDEVTNTLQKWRWIPELRFINQYFEEEKYIETLASSVEDFWAKNGKPQKIIFSYHGIPKRYLTNGDPYHCFCLKTTRLVKEKMKLSDDQIMTTFQSRFGREEWLQPYTSETLKELPGKGIKDIHIISPGFSADCLETLEELEEENREYFIESGGEKYKYIPCLNDNKEHLDFISYLIIKNTHGWNKE